MDTSIQPVVIAGGSGTRLWPLSREMYPKQFLPLAGKATMLQQTLQRLDGLDRRPALVVCNDEHRFLVAEQCRAAGTPVGGIILEPAGRNTAPAVALAALHAQKRGEDPLLLVLAADHFIRNEPAFVAAVRAAVPMAAAGHLVTFGIVPSHPETGYGYIRADQSRRVGDGYAIASFVEKPDAATAASYLAAGGYSWNSGMFLLRCSLFLEELQQHAPAIHAACAAAIAGEYADLDFVRIDRTAFEKCPSDSIDYAVMEHTRRGAVLPVDIGWSDVGSYRALWEIAERDGAGNATHGDVIVEGATNCYLRSDSRLVAALGVDNIAVVETADAVLVAALDKVQDVKNIVTRIRGSKRSEHQTHLCVYRPWGSYESLDFGSRFQVKRITVKPGASLSLQMHYHRAEHWIVVTGTAIVERDGEQQLLSENESTFIPVGTKHRLINPGKVPLELIEVQSGSYLGEDDIVRFDDKYGRAGGC
jgi:mannose-1-phosphate guanylyltransferase/mannose-6-phosphate isomerase